MQTSATSLFFVRDETFHVLEIHRGNYCDDSLRTKLLPSLALTQLQQETVGPLITRGILHGTSTTVAYNPSRVNGVHSPRLILKLLS